MLIKFQSEGAASFEMFQEHAGYLISLMGLSNRTEGAISGEALVAASEKLRGALTESSSIAEAAETEDDDDAQVVSLSARAMPLIEMLDHAIANDTYVMWQPD